MEIFWLIRLWFESRPYRRLWLSVPALLVGLAWVGLGIVLALTTSAATQGFYSALATRALATQDYPTARVACNRLLLSWPGSRGQNLFNLGLAMYGLRQGQEGTALMNAAAPFDQPGFAPAHLFVARQLLVQTNVTAAAMQQAERHLKYTLKMDPNSAEAHLMLGRLYFQMRNWEAAKDHLEAVASSRPETAILLASVAKAENDDLGMRRWAGRAVEYFRSRADKAQADNPLDRLGWATALAIQQLYAEAIAVLEAGRKKADHKAYVSGMAGVYADWAAQVAKTDPANLALRLKLLQQGLECDPNSLPLVELLLPLTHLTGAEAKDAEGMLTRMLAEGGSSAMLHFFVGNDALRRGDTEMAAKHFKLAFELSPNLPVVANMMALMLAIGKEPDLPRALAIVQAVVDKYPNEPDVRNTRGTILVKLGRWEEGVKDLEFALPQLRVKGQTHASLALAYRNLGMGQLAAEHERLARELSAPRADDASRRPEPAPAKP